MTESLRVLPKARAHREWWRGATIYQVYPRSFVDSNADGIGDLPGITSRLDYIASLGVDAVWISPFFKSPMADFGYDVSDYCDVDPIFGTLADFDALVEKAHALGLNVLIDQVYSHTSDQHAWFTESRSNRNSAKADWYVWADPKADGSPPNNWQSVFGGPAWTWDARRRQYYMHNFLSSQPQLNGHNQAVQDAVLSVMKFWLDRGVDGFRLDALNFFMHDPALTDNPSAPPGNDVRTRPFDYQLKLHNQSHADIPLFVERMRSLFDKYGARFTVAEVGGKDAEREMKLFTHGNNRLNSAYGFNFLYAKNLVPGLVREALEQWPDEPGTGWPSWAFENHDAPRAVSRWAAPDDRQKLARLTKLLLLTLRGNAILYNGEELGLTQVDIPFERLQDPEAIANWPLTLSRDGVRTPMPWHADAEHCGFTTGEPWLPLGADHAGLAIDRQEDDAESLLNLTRRLIAFRKAHDALLIGKLDIVEAQGDLLVFERSHEGAHLMCAFNLGRQPVSWQPSQPDRWRTIESINCGSTQHLPPFGAYVAERLA